MPSTIRDVAREAGVSVTTVSRVFNRSELVNETTKELVRTVATRLQYVPNPAARSLVTSRTHVLGAVLPELFDEFFPEIIRGIDETAQAAGYQVLLSSSHNKVEDACRALGMMRGRVDGLIAMAPYLGADRLQEEWPKDSPVVFLHPFPGHTRGEAYCINNKGGARLAVQHLLDLGHERIAMIQGREHNVDAIERREGYREALHDAGLVLDPKLEIPGQFTRESGSEAAQRILALEPRPTAVFAANDYMGMGAMKVFLEAGLRVPEDIALIGFDDVPSSRYAVPALSTIHVPMHELGQQATRRLLEFIQTGDFEEACEVVLPTSLVIRASTVGGRS